ncbi:esterase-like activity of phytase family protein [Sphingomonas sanguinis]|nr:esterase-like activity of phytase family protein [Sphingomonas sanguinis]
MAMLAVGLAPASSMAEQAKAPTLELIGVTAIPHDTRFQGIAVGGLSGLDRLPGGSYLAISDDKGDGRPPRFYRLSIALDSRRHRMEVKVNAQILLRDAHGTPFPTDRSVVDPEAIRHAHGDHVYWSSEGTWNADPARRVQPAIYESDAAGRILRSFSLPATYLYVDNRTLGAVSNGVIEGLAVGPRGTVYAINEAPAYQDGATDGGSETVMRHRLTSFDPKSGKPLHQYMYEVPGGRYSVSELLAIDDRHFLSIERIVPFDAQKGVMARIVMSGITNRTTDILSCSALTSCPAVPMTRTVLLDLPERYQGIKIDNLEGMAWGPRLRDGRRTLIVEADDNFSKAEVSQFLAFTLSN